MINKSIKFENDNEKNNENNDDNKKKVNIGDNEILNKFNIIDKDNEKDNGNKNIQQTDNKIYYFLELCFKIFIIFQKFSSFA